MCTWGCTMYNDSCVHTRNEIHRKEPPGPWRLPVIGNMHQLARGLPHQIMRELAKRHGPVMRLKMGQISAVVLSSPDTARHVMKTHDVAFASRPPLLVAEVLSYNYTSISFTPQGEYWRQLRKICTLELLSSRRVQSFGSVREYEASRLVKRITSNAAAAETPINLTEEVISTKFNIISTAAFGKKSQEHEAFISVIMEGVKLASGFNLEDVFPSVKFLHYLSGVKPKLNKLRLEVDRILDSIICEHRARKSSKTHNEEDLVDVLLKFQDDKREFSLTSDNIKAVLLDMFGAGGETSSIVIDWAMCEMLKNPNVLKKVQAEIRTAFDDSEESLHELEYLKAVIKETLRLHPPAPLLLPRECSEACEINGHEIPVGTKVFVNAWAIGRDPRYWEDPECFKPERFLGSSVDYKGACFEYLPFGAGRRMCPGMAFGLAAVELTLGKLLYHFDWYLPNGMKNEELDMSEAFGVTARRRDDLYVVPVVYKSLGVLRM